MDNASRTMPNFKDIKYERPDIAKFKECARNTRLKLMTSRDENTAAAALFEFQKQLTVVNTAYCLCNIMHDLNTSDEFFNAEMEFFDEAAAGVDEMSAYVFTGMLSCPCAPMLKERFGEMIFLKAQNRRDTISGDVLEELATESALENEYSQIQSEAQINFGGKTLTLSMMDPYLESTDRNVRMKAHKAVDEYYFSKREKFDDIYDKMVDVRTRIAKKLGYDSFTELGYKRMERYDYNREDVARFRDAIVKYIVPITVEIRRLQKERLDVDKLMFYDLPCIFKKGNPVPTVSMDDYSQASGEVFSRVFGKTPSFFNVLSEHGFTDLISRNSKTTGGYCAFLEEYAIPFILMNANGTADDVATMVHEGGHAYAAIKSAEVSPFSDCLSPTLETCEIHSTAMEYLTYPYMERYYGDSAESYRQLHMTLALLFLPYGCMVDEFQHEMYDRPELTPAKRHEIWKNLEAKYQPFINYENHPFHEMGGAWMKKNHIFTTPFYYIDYCLAQICALQLWDESRQDYKSALIKYNQLCESGGTDTFLKLLEGAGLQSPFDTDVIKRLAYTTCRFLDL